jgi:SAM-dependent methyltransferase
MAGKVDLYDHAYGNAAADVYRQVRLETYGRDFGQTSWVTTEESKEIPRALGVTENSHVLEIGCGSGQYALHVAETTDCRITAVDTNEAGLRNARCLAAARNLAQRVRFENCDASKALPLGDREFDSTFSNDVLCHVPQRSALLREVFRVLKPGGRLLFSDALVIGGMVTHEELATRSSIGLYVFSPPGENEHLIEQAGFRLKERRDTTANAALISGRWRDAREERKSDLVRAEGEGTFAGVQEFLACVHALTRERRLLRYVYLAERPR